MSEEPAPEDDGGRRSRRAKAKAVDYAKEQEFSDEDLFEDAPPEERTVAASAPKRGRPKGSTSRKSKTPSAKSTALHQNEDLDDTYEMDAYRPAKPVYTEKGYDPTLLPIRERFPFMPEYEVDGSPRIDLIVGRRPIEEKELRKKGGDDVDEDEDDDVSMNDDDDDEEGEDSGNIGMKRGSVSPKKKQSSDSEANIADNNSNIVEYEYLVKFKNRSYLHLDWKTGADLESMNKSAKTIYRRYVKKLTILHDEELEDPNFDPSFAVPQKILAEEEQELEIELSDKELLEWEQEKEKEIAEEDTDDEAEGDNNDEKKVDNGNKAIHPDNGDAEKASSSPEKEKKDERIADWKDEDIDFSKFTLEQLQAIIDQDEPYYPKFDGCDNPYRDGYITEPPKKPRASYLFFQCTMRSYFSMRNPNASLGELMTVIGDSWMSMSETEQAPFLELAKQEGKQYEKERALMEKAQRPNEMWQPLRRCLMVLDRISQDGFANIFLEPVDVAEFPDYEEYVDTPMDLGTVRQKLKSKKYQAPEQFARDVRKVWNNCKIYNRHGSAIWHVADYMAKQFERLYHAWVLDFRERYLRWANPRARPWEHSCRQHDGKCGTNDEDLVLCDHCDAMYGYKCLIPPLEKLPTGVWHCPDCRPKLKSARGLRMMSAVSEHAARKRAELGDTPKRKVNQKMYLVKWMGLGYEFCTWETKDDVGNPALIAEFHKLNNSLQDEPVMAEEVVTKVLTTTEHVNRENAGGSSCIPDLRSQLYAQSRAFEFTKFGKELPATVCHECGPSTKTSIELSSKAASMNHPKEVLECLNQITYRLALQNTMPRHMKVNPDLPPLMCGEYEAVVPITSKGLMMNVGEINGSVAFLGYRRFPDGTKGPAEVNNIIRGVGDKIIAVDGVSTVSKSFKEVIALLRQSGLNKYAIMRFLEARFTTVENDFVSVGNRGRYTIEELKKKFSSDRKRVIVLREKLLEDEAEREEAQKDDDPSVAPQGSDEEDAGSEGEFQPESDDEAEGVLVSPNFPESTQKVTIETEVATPVDIQKKHCKEETKSAVSVRLGLESNHGSIDEEIKMDESFDDQVQTTFLTSETTHSLAYRLLNLDVGYSSDEGGDDACAYFIDGVDSTFTTEADVAEEIAKTYSNSKVDSDEATVPVRLMDFSSLGDKSKLVASVALTSKPPDADDFDENFPFPSRKAIEAKEAEARQAAESLAASAETPEKSVKRSTVKIEQIAVETAEIMNVWANVESAAATLQLPLNDLKRVLRGEMDEEFSDEVGGFRWQYAAAGAAITAGESKRKGSKQGKEAWLEFRDRLYDPSEPHNYKNSNRLRDYQVEGVNWLASTFYRKHGCILADEMGLGKTVQIVSYLEHLFRVEKISGPFLVVVPLSTVEHWRREFEGWTDMVCCVYHDRQRVWRDVLREYEWYFEEKPHTAEFLKFQVLVTTYDTLIGDFDVISQIPFRVAVVDEAHRLRNQKGKLLECMKEISAKGTLQHGFQSRVLMTGTPLQNDLNELWTLLNFIEPFKFPELDSFLHQYGSMASREQVESLQRKISPFMLRRVKEDVAKDIPAKEETVIDVELTAIQKQYYRAIFEHNHAFLNMGAGRATAPKLMNIQMELRKVCNHPCLLEGVEHREQDRAFKEFLEQGKLDGKSPEEQQEIMNEHLYIQTSGKMVLMDKLLPKLRQEGHKVLVFSQMVRMLDWISEYCEFRHFPHERLDGRVRGTDRQKSIDRFNKDEDAFLFLLSTRAGGVGINLTAADICIIFDSDWNPQNDVQAQARCHRIGQTKDVRIYRLVTSRSFEQEMFDRASKKLGLEQAVLGTFGHDEDDDKPTNKEMEQLLKKGAYALLGDDNDEIVKQFCADDIDSILAKRTRTRVVEGTKTASWLNKQGMVVNKSKFTSDIKSANLDMDDPLFWQKIMPNFVTPAIMSQQLQDLSDEIFGIKRKKGRGRGRWRDKINDEKKEPEVVSGAVIAATSTVTKIADVDALTAVVSGDNTNGETNVVDSDLLGHAAPPEIDSAIEESSAPPEIDSGIEESSAPPEIDPGIEESSAPPEIDSGIAETESFGPVETSALVNDEEPDGAETADEDEDDEDGEKPKFQLTRAHQRKIAKFVSDLKSMMESLLDEAEDDNLPNEEKAAAQKLLLNVSVREKIFNEEQRRFAKVMLKRLEGDRRRRCRTSDQAERVSPARKNKRGHEGSEIREELRIVRKKIKKRRKKIEDELEQPDRRRRKNGSEAEIGDDGYKVHSDDEAEWSDVADELYGQSLKRNATITRKEARRRRQWAGDDDAATAAGRAWPALPRTEVSKVLGTLLDQVVKHDNAKGGIFSVPVPRDEFPEYYEQIKTPMDYGTMKTKLDNGEYRSAQAMQKDFIQVMQNCLMFNAADSEIVQEARQQALMRPNLLRSAASKHDLFLSEDGSVLYIVDDNNGKVDAEGRTKKRGRPKKNSRDEDEATGSKHPKKRKVKKKSGEEDDQMDLGVEDDDVPLTSMKKKKPRIKISLQDGDGVKRKKLKMNTDIEAVEDLVDYSVDDADVAAAPSALKKRARKLTRDNEPLKDLAVDKANHGDLEAASSAPKKNGRKLSHATKEEEPPRRRSRNRNANQADDIVDNIVSKESAGKGPSPSSATTSHSDVDASVDSADYLDVAMLKKEREQLEDKSFAAARRLFTKRGRWILPGPLSPKKFRDVALLTLKRIEKIDRYSVFADPVSDSDAPGYSEVIANPMDLSTMTSKIEKMEYGHGKEAAGNLYADLLLMFDNCRLYNDDDGEVTEEAARILAVVPEIYGGACASILKSKKK